MSASVRQQNPSAPHPPRPGRAGTAALCLLALMLGLPAAAPAMAGQEQLSVLRAARRAALRSTASLATDGRQPFALLVIPVDFADARLPDLWEAQSVLGGRLFPTDGEALGGYYRVASRDRLDLRILLAPLVRLEGTRRDYSDLDLAGYTRTRRLAREALEGARAAGLDFRRVDADGPDGLAGSGDDDGQVDGVLVLHAGPGEENDPEEGLVQALQFYLEEPVVDRGVAASLYAVASMRSGPGIWAHEVGHLLGLEDRYDRRLSSTGGDILSRGGLGIFSLMGAGAWGTGAGRGAALLDAYSMAQLGWIRVVPARNTVGMPDTLRPTLETGEAWRVWTHGRAGPEYFLLETRGGAGAGPFDAAVPAGQLLVYHVDEEVPEAVTWAAPHLRVALLEADGDGALAAGLDRGRAEDLFPGPLGVTGLTPETAPASDGYGGPSEISLTAIASLPSGVSLVLADAEAFDVDLELGFEAEPPRRLRLTARETGPPLADLAAVVEALGPDTWGRFADGSLAADVVLVRDGDGLWTADAPPVWMADPLLPDGAATRFRIRLVAAGWTPEDLLRSWVWRDDAEVLDFAGHWPGAWTVLQVGEDAATTWHRWSGPPALTADGAPVLICTGAAYDQPEDWPVAEYENRADVVLRSGPLPAGLAAVRLVHAMDGELVRPRVAWDAGLVEFEAGDGTIRAAAPLDGYGGIVDPASTASLHGQPAFAGTDSLTADGPWRWRIDLVPVPELPAPVRLRLRFASDGQYGGRGWVVSRIEPASLPTQGAAFPVAVLAGQSGAPERLAWDEPGLAADAYAVEISADQGGSWQEAWSGAPESGDAGFAHALTLDRLDPLPGGPRSTRLVLRVVALTAPGPVASRPLAWYRDGGAGAPALLEAPYPNPAHDEVRLLVQVPAGRSGRLSLHDLRGRCLRSWHLTGGARLLCYDGRDGRGRRQPSGLYVFRIAVGSRSAERSVVLIH